MIRNNYSSTSSWIELSRGKLNDLDRKRLFSIFINNLNNISIDDIELLENSQVICIEFIDPNETLKTLIAFNKVYLDKNINYKYLEIDTTLIFGALHSIIPFSNHDPYVKELWCLNQAKQACWYVCY